MRPKTKIGFKSLIILGLAAGGFGCSLAATRPIQEMSNAEVAIRAARDLNADSLVPDIFRAANDAFYKAKRDFRLKDFENSKKHALRATRLAEQAEFEAYRLGGATPEAASRASAPEGAYADPEAAFRENTAIDAPPEPVARSNEPAVPPEPEPGIDYNQYVKQREEEAKRQKEAEEKEKDKKDKPAGTLGPQGPTGAPKPLSKPSPGVPVTGLNAPTTGALPPLTGGAPITREFSPELNQDLRPNPGSPPPQIFFEGAKPVAPTIEAMENAPIPSIPATPIPEMDGKQIEAQEMQRMSEESLPTIENSPISDLDRSKEDKQQ